MHDFNNQHSLTLDGSMSWIYLSCLDNTSTIIHTHDMMKLCAIYVFIVVNGIPDQQHLPEV
jgi:hypothetical protein